jgi:excisionase family DNA binding protein
MNNRISYSLVEASELTSLSVFTLKRQIRRGNLVASRIGRRVVIPAEELEKFVRAGRGSTNSANSEPEYEGAR